MFTLNNKTYKLVKIGLVRAGCPQELVSTPANRSVELPIIVSGNRAKLGYIEATNYYPSGIIVAGARRREKLLEMGHITSWAFVEEGVEVQRGDEITASQLMTDIDALLLKTFYPLHAPITGQPRPTVLEVFPFENRFVYAMRDKTVSQRYNIDADRRIVFAGDCREAMPVAQTGARYAIAPPMANTQSITRGGATSDLVMMVVRNWSNILEAVSMYLNYTRQSGAAIRTPMRPSFYPVNLSPAHKIAAALAKQGIDVFDFARWSAEAQTKHTKKIGTGEDLHHSKFAYVGDKNDPSTWHLPIHDAKHARLALGRVNQTKGIPSSAKAGVLAKIRRAAKHHGVDVSEKPTAGQKKWAAEAVV